MDTQNRPKVTPKDFFLWLGAMIALYSSVVAFLTLTFQYINSAYPDPLQYYDPYSGSIRFAIATLVVAFPLFLVLMRFIRNDIATHAEKSELWVRRWALYLTIFIAGFTVATDLVTLVYYFLDGEVTMRFALKVVMVFLVAGAGFLHFFADIRGYWIKKPNYAMMVGLSVCALIIVTIGSGFLIIGSPMDARQYKFDEQKVNDLQNIQSQVLYYYQTKGVLPVSLSDLQDPLSGYIVPLDPQSIEMYDYKVDGYLAFSICATFNKESRQNGPQYMTKPAMRPDVVSSPETDMLMTPWDHEVGDTCFNRTIDPELYPRFKK